MEFYYPPAAIPAVVSNLLDYPRVIRNDMNKDVVQLRRLSLFTLFTSSYSPLFLLVILRQAFNNYEYLHWGGINKDSLILFFQKYFVSTTLFILLIFGWIGFRITFRNINANAHNGEDVVLKDVKNKNSEAIGYIATYIIPFLFQSFNSVYEITAFGLLLFIIYRIYINSTMLLINPILSMFYAIYEIEYSKKGKDYNGLIVSREKYLKEQSSVKIYEIGHKLFFLTINTDK